jgi:hypothetical protein
MKKFTFVLMMMLAYAGFTMAQTIETFESGITMGLFSGGTTGMVGTITNPDQTGVNTSLGCGMMVRAKDGDPWQGWASNIPVAIDADANHYVHVKIWKPRKTKVVFKYETKGALGSNSGDVTPMTAQADSNKWEELVFNMGAVAAVSGMQYRIVLIPDFPAVVGLTSDINIYFDDIYVNNDPAVGSAPVQMIEDFEYMPLNLLLGDATDNSSMEVVINPYKTADNPSGSVVKFIRSKNGVPWGGFWSPTPIDLTTKKFVHVKVWKPRTSPVFFHIEEGAVRPEIASKYPQTVINGWQDMVWDYRDKTGMWSVIGLQPDREDPLTITEDQTIYFDEFVVNNDSTPTAPQVQTLNVDMHGSKLTAGQGVYFAGNIGGIYGSWATPGSFPGSELTDADGDSIYSTSLVVPNGSYEVKFFKGASWSNGDPVIGNRILPVNGSFNAIYKWGKKAYNLTLTVDMSNSGILPGQKVYVAGTFPGWAEPGTAPSFEMLDPMGNNIYTITLVADSATNQFKFFKGPGWNGGEWAGGANRILAVAGDMTANYIWGSYGQVNTRQNPLAGKIQMYPNPVRDELTIRTTMDVRRVIITNTVGKVVRTQNFSSENINTSNLSKGMYFVTFINRDGSNVTQKLIKD